MKRRAFLSNSAKLALGLSSLSIAPIGLVNANSNPSYEAYSAANNMGFQAQMDNFAKFLVTERDQAHCMFNNTWADPDGPHTAMVAALSTADKFEAMAAWGWPPWDKTSTHAWHSIYHGLDTAAGITTDNRFPFAVSSYGALKLDIPNVTVAGDGKWGLAFDLFLFKQQPFTLENVQSEIFIVLKRQSYDVPAEDATLQSCGVSYGHGRWSPSSNVHIFWRKDNPNVPFRQTIDIYDFIKFLKTAGFAQDTNILSGVYFGAEPVEGSGIWRIDSFYTSLGAPAPVPEMKPCFCFVVTSLNPFTVLNGASVLVDGAPVQTSKNTSVAVGSTHRFQIQPPVGHRFKQFNRFYWNKATAGWSLLDSLSGSVFDWTMPQPPSAFPDGWIVVAQCY